MYLTHLSLFLFGSLVCPHPPISPIKSLVFECAPPPPTFPWYSGGGKLQASNALKASNAPKAPKGKAPKAKGKAAPKGSRKKQIEALVRIDDDDDDDDLCLTALIDKENAGDTEQTIPEVKPGDDAGGVHAQKMWQGLCCF